MSTDFGEPKRNFSRASHRDHFHARRKTKFAEKFFAIFPRETERAHVGDTKTGDDGRKRLGIALGKLAVHEGALRPVHQLRQRDLVMEIGGNLVGDGLFGDRHDCTFCVRVLMNGK